MSEEKEKKKLKKLKLKKSKNFDSRGSPFEKITYLQRRD